MYSIIAFFTRMKVRGRWLHKGFGYRIRFLYATYYLPKRTRKYTQKNNTQKLAATYYAGYVSRNRGRHFDRRRKD